MALLHKNDTVAFIAPSCGLQGKDLSAAITYFKKIGLNVILAENLNQEYRYLAGTDKERAEVLNSLYANSDIKALFCIRGGAGATRMLEYLDYSLIKKNPKPIVGLSDSTALQNAVYTKTGGSSLTGFLPLYDFKENGISPTLATTLEKALFDEKHFAVSGKAFTTGKAKGVLIGGCLSVLTYLCGTPYFPDLKDKILLLEDVGEKTYKIDLMLTQLKQQKNFDKLKGIIFGAFTNCPAASPEDGVIADCIKDFTQSLTIPVITDFAYGHIPEREILPIGTEVVLSASSKKCCIEW